jgi:hypothetical protein
MMRIAPMVCMMVGLLLLVFILYPAAVLLLSGLRRRMALQYSANVWARY